MLKLPQNPHRRYQSAAGLHHASADASGLKSVGPDFA
jgi:hypothetical protein